MDFLQQKTQQQNEYVQVHTELSDIYADIKGELCSKQSTLMNKLKNKFSVLYSDLIPSHYVIINHILSLSDCTHSNSLIKKQIKMATENGVILLVKQTYLNQKIFINGISEQELIFNAKGTYQPDSHSNTNEQNHKMAKALQKIILLANDSLSLNKLYGATILVHLTVSPNTSYYKQKIMLAVFFAILIANNQLNQICVEQIYLKLYHSNIFTPSFLSDQFAPFKQGQLLMIQRIEGEEAQNDEVTMESFKIQGKQKLLFFDLDLNQNQLNNLRKSKNLINQLINKAQQSDFQKLQEFALTITDKLKDGHVSLSEYVKQMSRQIVLNENFEGILGKGDEQFKGEINKLLVEMGKQQNECILSQNYMIFLVKAHEVHEKIRVLRKFMREEVNQNPEMITNRFGGTKGVDRIIFSSSPSMGIAVFNPEHQIWFK